MDEEYDAVVLGTGLKECILSGLLSVEGYKVRPSASLAQIAPHSSTSLDSTFVRPHLRPPQRLPTRTGAAHGQERLLRWLVRFPQPEPDVRAYVPCTGTECPEPPLSELSLSLNDAPHAPSALLLSSGFRKGETPSSSLGASRDYTIDLVPKLILAKGNLANVLIHTDVTKYLEFKSVDGSFVLNSSRVEKVPATDWEALRSPLMGLFEKRRAAKFLSYCQQYNPTDSSTWQQRDLDRMTMYELYQAYGLQPMTVDFLGHAVALHRDDQYWAQPAKATVMKIKLYYESIMRYEGLTSPYIYPLYGLGELPQAFARLSAVHGGTYMLDKAGLEVEYDEEGVYAGVRCGEEFVKSKFVVGDPSYFRERVIKTGQVVRAMCILNHPIPGTGDVGSVQMILPQKQVGRKSDVYVFCCSAAHNVAPKNTWLAFVSTTVETGNPEAELECGLSLLGGVQEKFVEVVDVFEPLDDGKTDKVFISKGYDATSHFETEINDVLDMYERITGKTLDLEKSKDLTQQD